MVAVLLICLVAIAIGIAMMAAAVNSKTAFTLLMALVAVMSVLTGLQFVSFIGGIVITVIIAFIILVVDELAVLN